METLKTLGWWISFLLACALVLLVSGHQELTDFAHAHRGLAFYLLLVMLLAIPAKVVALVAVYLIELLCVGWSRCSLRMLWKPEASVRLDIVATLVMLLLPQRWLGYVLSFGLLYLIDLYAAQAINISVTPLLSVWAVQILCLVLLHSLINYWVHRLEHAVPALWALHKFHHSADRMTILTSSRGIQLTKGIESGLAFVPMALLTAPTAAAPLFGTPAFLALATYFVYRTLISVNGGLCHSNLTTDYGWIGRWLVVSPRMHRLHHAATASLYNKNFSNDLVLWDRLFGTYARRDTAAEVSAIPVGLTHNPFNQRSDLGGVLHEYFITTLVVFWRELRRGLPAFVPGNFRQQP